MKIRTSSKTTRSGSSACWRLLSHRLLLHGAEIGQVPSLTFTLCLSFSLATEIRHVPSQVWLCVGLFSSWAYIYICQRTQFCWRLHTISMSSCPNVTIKEHNWIGQLIVHTFLSSWSNASIKEHNWIGQLIVHTCLSSWPNASLFQGL